MRTKAVTARSAWPAWPCAVHRRHTLRQAPQTSVLEQPLPALICTRQRPAWTLDVRQMAVSMQYHPALRCCGHNLPGSCAPHDRAPDRRLLDTGLQRGRLAVCERLHVVYEISRARRGPALAVHWPGIERRRIESTRVCRQPLAAICALCLITYACPRSLLARLICSTRLGAVHRTSH